MAKKKFKEKILINIALEKELKEKLEAQADALGITTCAYIRMILIKNS